MNPNEAFMRAIFARYYGSPLFRQLLGTGPERLCWREYGYIHFSNDWFDRHHAVQGLESLVAYMQEKVPQHSYYSSAYYEKPAARPMKDKSWLGADLIFDLDADHLPGADKMGLAQQLDAVKQDVIRLVRVFLAGDFGLDPAKMTFRFSGGRGYHVHVYDPKWQELDTHARRALVDYIMLRAPDVRMYVHEHVAYVTARGKRITSLQFETWPGGWKGRYASRIIDEIQHAAGLPAPEGAGYLCKYKGIGPKYAEKLLEIFQDPQQGARRLEMLRRGETCMLDACLQKIVLDSIGASVYDDKVKTITILWVFVFHKGKLLRNPSLLMQAANT